MKKISFKVAEAIKEAGYPQELYYGVWYFADIDSINAIPFCGVSLKEVYWVAPTYLEVWLWLWREKHIAVEADYSFANDDWFDGGICGDKFNDPEEAIIAAINYLVDNNLIK